MKCSIGGYNIANYEDTGKDRFKVELYRHDQKLATIENLGDEFIDIKFEPIPDNEQPDYYKFILNDLYELSFELAPVIQEDSLFKSFLLTQYTATLGFMELLLDFNDLVILYDSIPSKQDADYYIIGSFGKSWFTRDSSDKKKTHFWKFALTHYYLEAEKTLEAHANSRRRLDGRLVAAAILKGEMDWNITFEDYGELYNP